MRTTLVLTLVGLHVTLSGCGNAAPSPALERAATASQIDAAKTQLENTIREARQAPTP